MTISVTSSAGNDAPDPSIFNRCVRCGLCLQSCPTYLETLTETSGPRGRISLIKSVSEGALDLLSPEFVHQMSECLDCRACEAVCPSGVHYGQLVETARTQIVKASPTPSGFARFRRFVALRLLFANLGSMRAAAGFLRFYQRSGLQELMRRSGILRSLGLAQTEALSPQISSNFFVPRGQRYAVQNPRATVVLHAGCVMHVAFADVNEATVRVLQRAGCTVLVPASQGCCGAIAVHAGEMDFGRELARKNIVAFEESGADYYVINAAGCGSTLKEYGEMFAQDADWSARAADFSAKVRDVSELLAHLGLPKHQAPVQTKAVYQDACHLAHAQRITTAPRTLLAGVPGLQLLPLTESAVCCGSAGVYNLTQPEMSQRLGSRKITHIIESGADLVITANPGCAMQIKAGLTAAGSTIAVKHIVEVLDEAK